MCRFGFMDVYFFLCYCGCLNASSHSVLLLQSCATKKRVCRNMKISLSFSINRLSRKLFSLGIQFLQSQAKIPVNVCFRRARSVDEGFSKRLKPATIFWEPDILPSWETIFYGKTMNYLIYRLINTAELTGSGRLLWKVSGSSGW